MTATPSATELRRIVGLAGRAPSVHNTQPWRWRLDADGLELNADRSRQLRAGDPQGRNLVISCGTALHHAEVAAQALGWSSQVQRVPHGPESTLLARLTFVRDVVPPGSAELIETIERRCTDRRRFTSWPVPEERLAHLAKRAETWGTHAVPLTDVTDRFRAELFVNRALDSQGEDDRVTRELQEWVDHGGADGIPSSNLPASNPPAADQPRGLRPSRFPLGVLEETDGREVEGSDGLIVLCGPDDDVTAWLQAGEGLSALWLAATTEGLSVVPLSHVVDVPETREALQREVLGGLAKPLILVRVGWQPISRSELPRTPRRPVDEILDVP